MTSEEPREPSWRRATEGLDWRASPPPPPPETLVEPSPQAPLPAGGHHRPLMAVIVSTAVAAALVGGMAGGAIVALLSDDDSTVSAPAVGAPSGTSLTVEQTAAVAETAARVRPSVVRIDSTRRGAGGAIEHDVGSGVVLDREGHIVTNAHVVLNTDSLKVVFADGSERPAILLGHDFPFTDLAVLQVGPGNITPIEVGDSNALVLGETVVAIGNPLAEFDGSVTVGVVSGLNRVRVFDQVRQDDIIQTDAAINNGNSGGALANLRGQFIGMPTAILRQSRSGPTVEGISFALPASRVLTIAQRIIETGSNLPRPTLGIDHLDLSPEVIARVGRVAVDEGAIVMQVTPGGPAAGASIQAGDIIIRIADQDVNRASPLLNALLRLLPGDTVRVVFNRNGRIIEAEVRLAKRS